MALLEHRICQECGKVTWHEFVDRGVPGCCHWICRECGGRRATPRVSLGPEYASHVGKIQTDTDSTLVRIVDFSILGAKLQFKDKKIAGLERGDSLLFNPMLQPVGPLGEYRGATVRWTRNGAFGIAFKKAIFASAADLHCIIKG